AASCACWVSGTFSGIRSNLALLNSLGHRGNWALSKCRTRRYTTGVNFDCMRHKGHVTLKSTSALRSHCVLSSRSFHTTSGCHQRDFYEVLGISRTASQKEIKKAYYQLAKKYHPDTNPDDPDATNKFAELALAYETLSDELKKKQYDTYGSTGASSAGQQWRARPTVDPDELFRKIFGDFAAGHGFGDGNSMFDQIPQFVMELTFMEAAKGANKQMNFQIDLECTRCRGKGYEPGTKVGSCYYCHGTGLESLDKGPLTMRTPCRRCGGRGFIIITPCLLCGGSGLGKKKKKIIVAVPAGVADGQSLKVPVETKYISVLFRVEKSPEFHRDGADIHSDVYISVAQAILGGNAKVQGLYSTINIAIPPGIQTDQKIKLEGKGIPLFNNYGYGDHYVYIKLKVPKKLTRRQRKLLSSFAEDEKDVEGTVNGITRSSCEHYEEEDEPETNSRQKRDEEHEKREEGFFYRLKKMFM
ncbi:hypothetical protein DNTS_014957, partial [Danionella cerebrum]